MAVEVANYEPGRDDDDLLALRGRVWGADHPLTDRSYFEWLYQANPLGRGSGTVLRRDGKMIGFAGLLLRRITLDGEAVPAGQVVDYMVDTEARGGMAGAYGLRVINGWVELARSRGLRFGMGFPNANSQRLVTSPRGNWRVAYSPVLMLRPFARLSLPAGKVGGLPAPLAAAVLAGLAAASRLSQVARTAAAPGRAASVDRFGPAFGALCAESCGSGVSRILRDVDMLNWRYADHPVYRYDTIAWEIEGKPAGFAVTLRRAVFGVDATLLVELAVLRDRPGVAFSLLAEVNRRARAEGSALVATLAIAGSQRFATLARFGFLPVPRRLDPKPFVMTVHDLGMADVAPRLAAARWDFDWADMDVV